MTDEGNDEKWYEFESVEIEGANAGEDAVKCCEFCFRLPITSLAIIGGTIIAVSYFLNNPDPITRLGGLGLTILILALIVGFFYYRYKKKETIVHHFDPVTQH